MSHNEPAIGGASEDSDISDVYSEAAASTDTDDAPELMDFTDDQASATEADDAAAEEEEDEVVLVNVGACKSKPKSSAKPKSSQSKPKAGKGIDLSLPPIDTIEDIFADVGAKALRLGFSDVLKEFKGHHINVATMCSGYVKLSVRNMCETNTDFVHLLTGRGLLFWLWICFRKV